MSTYKENGRFSHIIFKTNANKQKLRITNLQPPSFLNNKKDL
jgi:hypothetical protein